MTKCVDKRVLQDALIERISQLNADGEKAIPVARELIRFKRFVDGLTPTVSQWIPCSERLPEEEGWYLVTIQNDKTRKRRTENDLFAIGIAEAHKHTPYKFCKDGHRQTVIAWMPLPEPYKEETERRE